MNAFLHIIKYIRSEVIVFTSSKNSSEEPALLVCFVLRNFPNSDLFLFIELIIVGLLLFDLRSI